MIRLPRQTSSDPLFAAYTQAVERALADLQARIANIEANGVVGGGTLPDITGPAVLGLESGTGQPVAITLGPGLSIVSGVLTYTAPSTDPNDYQFVFLTPTTLEDYGLVTDTVTTSADYGGLTVSP
mgnify:CR=1 FL=1